MRKNNSSRIEKRKRKLVDRLLQGTMVRRVVLHWVSFVMLSFFIVTAMAWMMSPLEQREGIIARNLSSNAANIVLAILLVPVLAMDTIKLTHRFVGPMVRVRRELKNLSNGVPAQRLRFRPNDFWHDIADDFNTMCDTVEPILADANMAQVKRQPQSPTNRPRTPATD